MLLNLLLCIFFTSIPQSGEKLWEEKFDYPDGTLPGSLWNEGNKAVIKDGRLFVDADSTGNRASTIWFDQVFSGNLRVEFDVCIISSKDNANNINFFFLYSDPSGIPLRESAHKRKSGQYSLYHQLNGYIFTNVTTISDDKTPETRYRFRDNPGFKIIDEAFTTGESESRRVYHVKITKNDNRFQYKIDDKIVLDAIDDKYNPVHEQGLLGLRVWHTSLWIDNLTVKKIIK